MVESAEHVYSPAVVHENDMPSTKVLAKALDRWLDGVRPTVDRVSEKVVVFLVPSERDETSHIVVFDRVNRTYRCNCTAGFYGVPCHHVWLCPTKGY